jgi:hypothetical protein
VSAAIGRGAVGSRVRQHARHHSRARVADPPLLPRPAGRRCPRSTGRWPSPWPQQRRATEQGLAARANPSARWSWITPDRRPHLRCTRRGNSCAIHTGHFTLRPEWEQHLGDVRRREAERSTRRAGQEGRLAATSSWTWLRRRL